MSEFWHPAQWPPEQLDRELQWATTRRTGPGGQHRNKVETAVIVTHVPTEVRAEASERRSQAENRQVARFRLRMNLALAVRRDPPQDPSPRWLTRVQGGRLRVNPQHDDYPALLAELLDHWQAADLDLKVVADTLRVSASQLIKFLKADSNVWQWVNRQREQRGWKRYQ